LGILNFSQNVSFASVLKFNLAGTTFNDAIPPSASYQPIEQTGTKIEILIRYQQQSMQGLMRNQDILIQWLQNILF